MLLARVEARLRDVKNRSSIINRYGLRFDALSMTGYYKDTDLLLTQKEFLLLRFMSENVNDCIAPDELYRNIWGRNTVDNHSALHTTVSRVNKKLERANVNIRVGYNRGEGYTLEEI